MKKQLFLLSFLLLPGFLFSENLKFVTVLSSPVGTFNRLEEVNPAAAVKSPVVNFCTKLGTSGTVNLQGPSTPEMTALSLRNETILGGNGKDYILSSLTVRADGTLKGSRLLANTVQVPTGEVMGKSTNLYSNSLTVAGAKSGKLYVNGTDAVIEKQGPANVNMVWNNEYQNDPACDKTTGCPKQYLLKQQGNTSPFIPINPDPTPTYVWVKQSLGNPFPCSLNCVLPCSTEGRVNTGQSVPAASSLPSTYAADKFNPNCSSARVGASCMVKALSASGLNSCHCVTYKCQEQ